MTTPLQMFERWVLEDGVHARGLGKFGDGISGFGTDHQHEIIRTCAVPGPDYPFDHRNPSHRMQWFREQ